ncbi:MarR family winged helix-turn-helix transcriptional regulator [Saccharothrix australiensis]|uniref:DNA-binding MarR family transcriptional regulator n=1 Tax=Saccharothrix australiensis TaxID=2072 RepID=A0A495VZ96_9PSEU|nr:MarR family transcriptional regulator [Saccharothrix australiensis]RKT54544.1 DNA-binding MarR family transcriptional regulator [Saccharothrix australiensis]
MGAPSDVIAAWRELLTTYNGIATHLDQVLQSAHGLNLNEFETLDRLIEPGTEYRPMKDLAQDMYLSQSALSRTVARLEKDGLVERQLCATDRRIVDVSATDLGRERHAEAAATRLAVLVEHLGPGSAR